MHIVIKRRKRRGYSMILCRKSRAVLEEHPRKRYTKIDIVLQHKGTPYSALSHDNAIEENISPKFKGIKESVARFRNNKNTNCKSSVQKPY